MIVLSHKKRLTLLRALVLLLFLPAHVAFVLLIDLHFIPGGGGPLAVRKNKTPEPGKERLRLHLHRRSESRIAAVEAKFVVRDLDPWTLPSPFRQLPPAGDSVETSLTKPASIRIWLAATPHNHRAPPA